jgi:colanic acid biosynthesis glycosyl transferase WcaI
MKILILNHAFYPDVVSTAQHATDLAVALADAGHEVTAVCNRRGYDDPKLVFPSQENWKNIRIVRVRSTGLGKSSKLRRALDFATFITTCSARILFSQRFDVIVALTSPPLISFIAALAIPLKARRLVFWSMDLNPDEAIAAGWLRENSCSAGLLSRMLLYSFRRSERIIALDRFMKGRICAKNIDEAKINVVPPWSHNDRVFLDERGRQEFRIRYHLSGKFVVMYSGNHSPCHPLDTLIHAAQSLAGQKDIVFCFVGGGSEFQKLNDRVRTQGMDNVLCLPYQPIEKLSASLSAADLHVVVMGNEFVGIVHPCKIYNILTVGKPFLYIGPQNSHISDIMAEHPTLQLGYASEHGDVDAVLAGILAAKANGGFTQSLSIADRFSRKALMPRMFSAIDGENLDV